MRAFLLCWGESYEVRNQWIIQRPALKFIRETQRMISPLLKCGPTPTGPLLRKACALGLRPDVAPQWISDFCQARILGPVAIQWKGSLADKTVALLEYSGEPMGIRTISELLGPSHNIGSLWNFLAREKRIRRVKRGVYALRT